MARATKGVSMDNGNIDIAKWVWVTVVALAALGCVVAALIWANPRSALLRASSADTVSGIRLKRGVAADGASEPADAAFEAGQLSKYYAETLAQSQVAFWFAIASSAIGFFAIIFAATLYTNRGAIFAQTLGGLIMEAVATLAFVQSKNAQQLMMQFFEKLRIDRVHTESRRTVETVKSEEAKDALKIYLSLHYAGVPAAEIIARDIYAVIRPSQIADARRITAIDLAEHPLPGSP